MRPALSCLRYPAFGGDRKAMLPVSQERKFQQPRSQTKLAKLTNFARCVAVSRLDFYFSLSRHSRLYTPTATHLPNREHHRIFFRFSDLLANSKFMKPVSHRKNGHLTSMTNILVQLFCADSAPTAVMQFQSRHMKANAIGQS